MADASAKKDSVTAAESAAAGQQGDDDAPISKSGEEPRKLSKLEEVCVVCVCVVLCCVVCVCVLCVCPNTGFSR
jgi:hypothetical protein